MTISVWRYSHLVLAVSSFLLLVLASVTGIILAFEPLLVRNQPYRAEHFADVTVAQTLSVLKKTHPDLSDLTVDKNSFVQVKGTDAGGKKLLAYVDPQTGKVLGSPQPANEFFQWVTALHRSLFMHETGRFFIGLDAFLLLLITLSGTMLIIQRQRGIRRFFSGIVRENFAQYYHVVLGRWSLLPISLIALSGTYLSLARFELFDTKTKTLKVNFEEIKSAPLKKIADMEVFRSIRLTDVDAIEYPFSEDAEDYFTLKLKDREIAVNQLTGEVLAEVKYPRAVLLTNLSLDVHTGRASSIWAIVLAVATANIFFFIYSGFAMTLRRRSNRTKNKYKAEESRFIILVGSENGSTFGFARLLHKQLLKAGEKSFVAEINTFTFFPKAEYLIVMTATYGLGDAPTNSSQFAKLIGKYPQIQPLKYSVVGFGSQSYPDFCKFAFDVNHTLSKQSWAVPLTDIHTVDDKSPADFGIWAEAWSQQTGITLSVLSELKAARVKDLEKLTVISNTANEAFTEGIFNIALKAGKKLKVTSGDLLALYPANDHRERLYSVGIVDGELRLSIRLHPSGLGSTYLKQLVPGEKIPAKIIDNHHFHFPDTAPEVVMISNGTGIAPFIGMLSQNTRRVPVHLYCGFRDSLSYGSYKSFLKEHQSKRQLLQLHPALSREGEKHYVSQILSRDADFIGGVLNKGGVIMICGSLAMQTDVMQLLDVISLEYTKKSISYFQSHNQILTDCY
ncbi:MAG: PepSY domain-containing protein [Pedobacter sp.]|uniref:PepSY domain-containing protein n=1 Tax=Pedobacter sp. TaxID=1411316 RepID=UPI0033991C79